MMSAISAIRNPTTPNFWFPSGIFRVDKLSIPDNAKPKLAFSNQ